VELHEITAALGFWKLRKWAAWLIFGHCHPTHFDVENGGSLFFWIVGKTTYLKSASIHQNTININNGENLEWILLLLGIPRQTEVAQMGSGQDKAPDLLDFRHYKDGRSSAKSTGRLYPRRNPWYSFSEAESTSGHMVLSEVTTKKTPSDTTGDRSRDRPTSSAALKMN